MENNTKLTKELYASFLRRHNKTSLKIIRVCYVIILLAGLTSLITGIIYGELSLFSIIYCFTFGILFILYDIFLVKINLWLVKDKNIIDSDYHFIFNENDMQIELLKDGNILVSEKVNYSLIYKIIFYEDGFYVYINRVNAYIVSKGGFNSTEDYQKTLQILLPFANNNKKK